MTNKRQQKSMLKCGRSSSKSILLGVAVSIAIFGAIVAVLAFTFDLGTFFASVGKAIKPMLLAMNFMQYAILIVCLVLITIGIKRIIRRIEGSTIFLFTSVLYSIIYFITFGGINFINSFWFLIILIAAELLVIISSMNFNACSFKEGFKSIFFQLFSLIPIWFVLGVLIEYGEKKDTFTLNLLYLILQFATFTTILVFQLIIIFTDLSKSNRISFVEDDMSGNEFDSDDWSDL